jgi:hypothetical protein
MRKRALKQLPLQLSPMLCLAKGLMGLVYRVQCRSRVVLVATLWKVEKSTQPFLLKGFGKITMTLGQ